MKHSTLPTLSSVGLIAVLLLSSCAKRDEVSFRSDGVIETIAQGQTALKGGFPLPIYPNATASGSVSASNSLGREDSKFMMLSSTDDLTAVGNFYKDKLRSTGWNIDSAQIFPTMLNISASRNDLDGSVMITKEGSNTAINLSVSKKESNANNTTQGDQTVSPNKLNPPTD